MNHIIGGMFGLKMEPDADSAAPPFLANPHILLSTARSGIAFLVEYLVPNTLWMPSYLCDVMLKAVVGTQVKFYPIDTSLRVASKEWMTALREGDLVLFIDYFGFPTAEEMVQATKQKKAWVIMDASQALLSNTAQPLADFVLYSPRKYLGVPDGGILVVNNPAISIRDQQLPPPPPSWWLRSLRASVLRYEFDRRGGDREWFGLHRQVDSEGPISPYQMSELSQLLLRHHFDYSSIAQRRRDNYTKLLEQIGEYALFGALPKEVVPLGFPVRVSNRDYVRQHLFERNVYPPVHWPIRGFVPDGFEDSHRLSDEILTLVCDQRYTPEDMIRTAVLFRRVAEAI
jgi:dTDP-4-amino-4,6-dideoxygalactose transaminase